MENTKNNSITEIQLPESFVEKMELLLKEEWEDFQESYHKGRHLALRFNPLKSPMMEEEEEKLLVKLQIQESRKVPWALHGYYYEEETHPGKHPYHEAGVYYIQEPSAMAPGAMLPILPGMRVLDLCAAPGGKSTQLAGKMMQKGLLVSNEIHPARCKILSQNMERMGVRNGIVTNEDSETLAEHFPGFFHAIMVDAPCSGEGMFRKNPEAMKEWSIQQVELCGKRQLEILQNAARMLAPGGVIAYSTCTFSPEENEQVIEAFLELHPDFSVEEVQGEWFEAGNPLWSKGQRADIKKTFRLWPHKLKGEGHFLGILRRSGNLRLEEGKEKEDAIELKENSKKKSKKPALDKEQMELLQEFMETALTKEMQEWMMQGKFIMFGEHLYRLPEESPSLLGIKVLRAGLHIGTFKKNRFEPAHALAMALKMEEVREAVVLSWENGQAAAYLRGESLVMEEGDFPKENKKKGWCLVCVDGYSMGWCKRSGVQIKNHYPKGLRRPY